MGILMEILMLFYGNCDGNFHGNFYVNLDGNYDDIFGGEFLWKS